MKIITQSIRNQIIFWTGLCLLISNIAGVAFSIWTLTQQAEQARAAATAAGEETAMVAAQEIAGAYREELNTALDTSRQLAQSLSAISSSAGKTSQELTPSRESVSVMLNSILAANPDFMGIYADWEPNAFDGDDRNNIGTPTADLGGRFTTWWARGLDGTAELQINDFTYADEAVEDYYRLPMETRQETVVEPYVDTVDGKQYLMTSLIVPILSDEKFLGIVGVDITIADLQTKVDELASALYDGTAHIDIISNGGVLVASSGDAGASGKPFSEVDAETWAEIRSKIHAGQPDVHESDQEIQLLAPIQAGTTTTPWTVLLSVPKPKLTETADADYRDSARLLWIMIGVGTAFTGFALIFLWKLADTITRPIQVTAGVLREVAGGDLSHDVPHDLRNRKDEIGSLVYSTQAMTDSLRHIFLELSQSMEGLGVSSTRLLAVSAQTLEGASQSSQRAGTVAAAADEMRENTVSVAGRVEEVTMNLTSIAGTTEEMTATMDSIANSSQRARHTTHVAVQQSDRLSILMKEMENAAREIGKVTETITGISRQTNLLALNATIEAARAGQAGRGFAVVANEIRNLASQTADATDQIRERITSVQNKTASAASEIETNATVIKDVNETVALIVESIQAQSTATQDIAAHISHASLSVTEANQRMGQTAAVAQNIATEISGVSHTAVEMVGASSEIQSSAKELSQVSEQLREILAKYRYQNH